MPDNPPPPEQPEQPVAGELPEQPRPAADETAVFDEPEPEPAPAVAATPREPGRVRRLAGHRAAPIVAAALAGLLIGAGTMSLIAFAGGGDRDRDHDERRGVAMYDDDGRFEHRGPMMRDIPMRPWRDFGENRGDLKDRLRDRFEQLPIPDHHHDEGGNVVPGPAPESGSDSGAEPDQEGGN